MAFGSRLWNQGLCNHSSLTSDNIYDHVRDAPRGLALTTSSTPGGGRHKAATGPPQGHRPPSPRVWGLPTWPRARRVRA